MAAFLAVLLPSFVLAQGAVVANEFIKRITDNSSHDGNPQINEIGQIIWIGSEGHLFLSDDTVIKRLSNNPLIWFGWSGEDSPKINNIGQVVWKELNGNIVEVFQYNGQTTIDICISNRNKLNWFHETPWDPSTAGTAPPASR